MKRITLTLLTLLSVISLVAQSPQSFKYQAVARDNTGEIMNNQLVSFRISILQGSAAGTSMYSETHQLTTNDFGLVNLEIGNGSYVSGNFITIDWSAGSYFLKVEMDPTGGSSFQLLGSSQLLSVPYALYSENTANPGDSDWTISGDDMYSTVPGNVGIGTTAPSATLDVAGHIGISNTGNSVFLGNGAGQNDDLSENINTLVGYNSGNHNTTGSGNIAIGAMALFSNTDRSDLVAIGDSALFNNGLSVSLYYQAINNTAVGSKALLSNKSGYANTALGNKALYSNISGASNTAIGSSTLMDATGGSNTALGSFTLQNATSANFNTGIGSQSLLWNTSGDNNTAVGAGALYFNDAGSNNTAIGMSAGSGSSGNSVNGCIFIGYQAGYNESTNNKLYIENSASASPLIYGEFDNDIIGINGKLGIGTQSPSAMLDVAGHISISNTGSSVFIGQYAGLNDDLTDNANVYIGSYTGYNNTSGYVNTACGNNSFLSNTIGYANSSYGKNSLHDNTEGYSNTAIGTAAMFDNTVGYSNAVLGNSALSKNTIGDKNTAIGNNALYNTINGNNNTAIGYQAGFGSTGISRNGCVYLGFQAGYNNNSDNKLFIDNSSSSSPLIYGDFASNILTVNGNLGIGTQTPAIKLQVVGGTDASLAGGGYLVAGTTSGENLVFDENEIMARLNGAANTLHLQRDGGSLSVHYGQTATSQVYINSSGWTGIGTNVPNTKLNVNTATGEDAFRVQINYSTKFLVTSGGAVVVGYNNSSPTFALQLQNSSTDLLGRGLAYSWTIYSDDRLKSNQKQLEYGLKEVMQLQPKSYDHHSSDVNEEGIVAFAGSQKTPTIGFIAQEVQEIIPEAVYEPKDDSKDLWGMDYEKLIPVLTKAIQEQQEMIEELLSRIDALENN